MNKIYSFFNNLSIDENIRYIINQNSLNNRELAYLTIILLGIIYIIIKSDDRKKLKESFKSLLKAFFCKKLLGITIILFIWTIFICYLLNKIGMWDYGLIKNTLFWFISSGIFIAFKVIEIDKYNVKNYFKNILLGSVKITIILDFIQSTYVSNYWIELIIGIIMLFLGMIKAVIELGKETDKEVILNLLNKVFGVIGIIWGIWVISELITQPKSLVEFDNIFGFVDNIILTISMILPTYILKIYVLYENLFIRLKFLNIDNDIKKYLKIKIIFYAKLNITKLDFEYYRNIAWLGDKKKIKETFKELKKPGIDIYST